MLAEERPRAEIKNPVGASAEGKAHPERAKAERKQVLQAGNPETLASPTRLWSSDRPQPS